MSDNVGDVICCHIGNMAETSICNRLQVIWGSGMLKDIDVAIQTYGIFRKNPDLCTRLNH